MEISSNFLWLLIASGALILWRARWSVPGRKSHERRFLPSGFVALSCALLLLFPVISLTDDLHADQAVMEESSRSTLKARQAAQRCWSAAKATVPVASLTNARLPGLSRVVVGEVTPAKKLLVRDALLDRYAGRSPPSRSSQ